MFSHLVSIVTYSPGTYILGKVYNIYRSFKLLPTIGYSTPFLQRQAILNDNTNKNLQVMYLHLCVTNIFTVALKNSMRHVYCAGLSRTYVFKIMLYVGYTYNTHLS
jgi:hypothetical protein